MLVASKNKVVSKVIGQTASREEPAPLTDGLLLNIAASIFSPHSELLDFRKMSCRRRERLELVKLRHCVLE